MEEDSLTKAIDALEALAHSYPDHMRCWCEMAGNNPMIGEHSAACQQARSIVLACRGLDREGVNSRS